MLGKVVTLLLIHFLVGEAAAEMEKYMTVFVPHLCKMQTLIPTAVYSIFHIDTAQCIEFIVLKGFWLENTQFWYISTYSTTSAASHSTVSSSAGTLVSLSKRFSLSSLFRRNQIKNMSASTGFLSDLFFIAPWIIINSLTNQVYSAARLALCLRRARDLFLFWHTIPWTYVHGSS